MWQRRCPTLPTGQRCSVRKLPLNLLELAECFQTPQPQLQEGQSWYSRLEGLTVTQEEKKKLGSGQSRAANEWTKRQRLLNETVQNVGLQQVVLMGGGWEAKSGQERRANYRCMGNVSCYHAVLILCHGRVLHPHWNRREGRWSQRLELTWRDQIILILATSVPPGWQGAQVNMPLWCEEEQIIPCYPLSK